MNKNEMISAIAKNTDGITKKDITTVINAMIDTITSELVKGEEVRIFGLGKFLISERAAKNGKNPQTGDVIEIPAHKLPRFIPAKGLKEAVNE